MYRLYVTLLFAFLFSHFTANAQDLVLTGVSVDTIFPQQIKLTWLFDNNVDSITIYKCTNNCDVENNWSDIVAKIGMKADNLSWIDPMASPISQHYYSIGWRSSGKSAPKNNMALQAGSSVSGCDNVLALSWNPYIRYIDFSWGQSHTNKMDTLDYHIFYREKDMDTSFMFLDAVTHIDPATEIRYETIFLKNDTWYEFVVQAISKTDTVRPFSNIIECKTGIEMDDPVSVEITCISVQEDSYIEIEVLTGDFEEQPFQKLYLLRDKPDKEVWEKDLLSFKVIDSMEYNPKNVYHFIDENADPEAGLYYYMAVADNKCRANDISNVLTNIFLDGRRVDKYMDSVYFSQVSIPFTGDSLYSLYRIVYGKEIPVKDGFSIKNQINKYGIDVTTFMDDGAAIKYLIISYDGCSSNTLTIEHEPLIQFPNAFYPLSMNIENRTFYPILRFPPENDYLFIVFNRWGQEVYRSTVPPVYGDYANPQGRWDGTFRGKDCPSGFYAFKISYSFNEGAGKYFDTGSVMLVR